MALIDMEGGDHVGNFIQKGWTLNPDAIIGGRVRGQAWRMASGPLGANIVKIFPTTYPSVICGLAFQITGGLIPGAANKNIFQLYDGGGGYVAGLNVDNSTHLAVYANGGSTLVGTGTTPIAMNTWYYVELKIVVAGASGSCELHVNGLSSPAEIPATTGNFGTNNIGRFSMQRNGNNQSDVCGDDWYILDLTGPAPQNNFLGDVTVETLMPNGDGAHTAWVPTPVGTHWNKENEIPPDNDTTYVSSSNPGDLDTYTVTPLAQPTGAVYGVMTNLYARKNDAAVHTIAPVIRQSGTDNIGATTVGLSTSYLWYRQLYPLDTTGAAWTPTSVDNAEYGIKMVV